MLDGAREEHLVEQSKRLVVLGASGVEPDLIGREADVLRPCTKNPPP